jgi:hypothetical protein
VIWFGVAVLLLHPGNVLRCSAAAQKHARRAVW